MVQTVRRTIVVPQLLCNGYRRPCCAGRPGSSPSLPRGSLHGPNCLFDHGHSQLQNTMADVPVELVMQVHFLVVAQRPFLMVTLVWQTIEILQLQYAPVVNVPVELSGCAGRAVYLCARPGLTPAIRAEKGWRGRRELAPRRSATQLAARRHDPGQTRRVLNYSYHTHHHQAQTGCVAFV